MGLKLLAAHQFRETRWASLGYRAYASWRGVQRWPTFACELLVGFSRQVRVVRDLSRLELSFHFLLSSLGLQHPADRSRSRPEGRPLRSMFEAEPIPTG